MQSRHATALLFLVALVTASACSGEGTTPADDGSIRIAASTALIAEFAATVAGDDAQVSTLIPAGVDVHSYEPAPATAAAIAEADIVFVNGYHLEEVLLDIILANVADGTPVVPVAAGLTPLAGGHDDDDADHEAHDDDDADHEAHDDDDADHEAHDDDDADHEAHDDDDADHEAEARDPDDLVFADGDPHFWLAVDNAISYVEVIRDQLVALDPASSAGYESRAAAYIEELRALDGEIRAAIATIPQGDRQLVVLHDAYQYFAAAYDLEVIATLLPGGAQQDPNAGAVVALIELIRERGVPAIYREPQFNAAVLTSVADETGVEVLLLYSNFADGVASYPELMRANAAALVEGLGR